MSDKIYKVYTNAEKAYFAEREESLRRTRGFFAQQNKIANGKQNHRELSVKQIGNLAKDRENRRG